MEELQKKKLQAVIKELESIRGRHTELVTVYIPAGFNLPVVTNQLRQEQSTAQNIKSKTVRKNVLGALEKILGHLKLYKVTPGNGLAVFCGNVSAEEGAAKIEIWAIEPPEPLKIRMYRCDQTFILDPLKDLIRERELYGLIVVDKSDADIGLLRGKRIELLKHLESLVPGKTRKGGQCLVPETLVETNSAKPLADIRIGDRIKAYDFEKGGIKDAVCIDRWEVEHRTLVEITAKDGTRIRSSKDHIFFTTQGEKAAEELTERDTLLRIESSTAYPVSILKIRRIEKPTKLIDISVKDGNFIANGLVVHNSAARFARVREGLLLDFLKRVGEVATAQFREVKDLKGVIVGGPGLLQEQFAKEDYLGYEIKQKILGVVSTSYTGEQGLKELVDKAEGIMAEASVIKEKQLLDRFFGELARDTGLAIYGIREVMEALKAGNIEILLISEAFEWVRAKLKCKAGHSAEKLVLKSELKKQACPQCGEGMDVVESRDLLDELAETSEKMGTQLEMISIHTPKGEQLKELGGIAGIFRFKA